MLYVYMAQNCYLAFLLGQGLAFFGEDRLATLLCSLARFDLANQCQVKFLTSAKFLTYYSLSVILLL